MPVRGQGHLKDDIRKTSSNLMSNYKWNLKKGIIHGLSTINFNWNKDLEKRDNFKVKVTIEGRHG